MTTDSLRFPSYFLRATALMTDKGGVGWDSDQGGYAFFKAGFMKSLILQNKSLQYVSSNACSKAKLQMFSKKSIVQDKQF